MTDRTITLLVTLDQEYRIDDAQNIMDGINMIKGVEKVQYQVFGADDQIQSHYYKNKYIRELAFKLLEDVK